MKNRAFDEFEHGSSSRQHDELRRGEGPIQRNVKCPVIVFPRILAIIRAFAPAFHCRRQNINILGQMFSAMLNLLSLGPRQVHLHRLLPQYGGKVALDEGVAGLHIAMRIVAPIA